jgi:hypothetical protein
MPNPPISLGSDVQTNLQFYACTARVLLTFMHDDGCTGHLRISDLVLSPHFRDFMLLRHPGATVSNSTSCLLNSRIRLANSLIAYMFVCLRRSLLAIGLARNLFRKRSNNISRLMSTRTACCLPLKCAGNVVSLPNSSRVYLR